MLIGFSVSCTPSRHGTTGPGAASASGSAGTSAGSALPDGGSYETAVVIKEKSETAGVRAEYNWCAEHYPGYKTQRQALTNKNGKPYDILTIETADGSKKEVYFDISNFFGKF